MFRKKKDTNNGNDSSDNNDNEKWSYQNNRFYYVDRDGNIRSRVTGELVCLIARTEKDEE